MTSADDELLVFWDQDVEPIGLVRRAASGVGATFRYLSSETPPTRRVSHSLPVSLGTTEVEATFFEGLLPDGIQRERLARRLGVSDASTFTMLRAVGGDCAGALSLVSSEQRQAGHPPSSLQRPLTAELLDEMQRSGVVPTMVNEGLRLSLAGAQDKIAVVVLPDGTLAIPDGATPSTHILKFGNRDFRGLVANEHLVLSLAHAVGLSVATSRLWALPSGDMALLVERFDRHAGRRLHQEDFRQAKGLAPSMKYEADGGPSLLDMVQILTEASTEPRDPLTLVAIQAFNIAVGNNDGHTKNFSMLREPSVRLAPAYDLVCTRAWPALDKRLGISVGGQRDPGAVGPRAWATFAEEAKLSARAVVRVARELTEQLAEARTAVEARVIEQGADETAVRHAMGHISAHITRALKLHELEKAVPAKKR